ncbi:MAG TPA: bifunctional transaldolase/phosoglucose isomerase [Desulfomonilaceae bacterium]|nr:bifunctional transaldolase/phosoglucose isomerase [Desulfomonilaceae bacterium]
MTNPLRAIGALGQSVWYDNLGRELLRSGELKAMIEEDGITGVTSNPTIFEKAIGAERTYDNDLHYLVDTGLNVQGIYEGLVVEDIREAADLLNPVYEKTSAADGYVSLEVSPVLAYDRAGTIAEAKRLFECVDRKNLMIKVPATLQGLEAVEELIASGINVNVTLIFSLEQYRGAATAYIRGMERLIAEGGDPARIASVASFFVSRVDTMIDERLKDIADPTNRIAAPELMGKAAIANAKLAYAAYKEIFHGQRFADLKARGAKPQRVLWASTSTKNPDYPDTLYVDSLLGPETVNTMPAVTLVAYRDHGNPKPQLEDDLDEARSLFPKFQSLGIDITQIMDSLLEDGVKSFADSFDMLLEGIAKKRTRLLRGWGHRSASIGELQQSVDETLGRLDEEKLAESIWNGDVAVWTDDPQSRSGIGQRLGWLQAVETMRGECRRLQEFADEIRGAGFAHAVLLGMGGSSLATEVFARCFDRVDGYLDLRVLDTTVPQSILETEKTVDPERTLFIVASKSGGTIEVLSLYKYFRARLESILGETAGSHFIAITDPGTSLGKLASEHGFRRIFLNPADIGGRFSALSYFGLVPAALIGIDVNRLLMRAAQAVEASAPDVPALENPGTWMGAISSLAALNGCDKLSFIISPPLASFGLWLEQLIAESTGKEGKGILPIVGEPLGSPDVYGKDRLFVYLRLDGDGTYDQDVSALEQAGHPVITQRIHTAYDIGREMFRWEFATAVSGVLLHINPFDQPNVQESKDLTKRLLESYKKEGNISEPEKFDVTDASLGDALKDLFAVPDAGAYAALNAFIHPSTENRSILQEMRTMIRDRFKMATTLGFGPRYLHSTGQMHKGGPANGYFIEITAETTEDVPIPGEPYAFAALLTAQAVGDYQALRNNGRRIVRVHLKAEPELGQLRDILVAALSR